MRPLASRQEPATPPTGPRSSNCMRPPNTPKHAQRFSLLGSTGSIGTQTLDIIAEFPDKFELVALSAGSNVKVLADQVSAPENDANRCLA